MVEVAATSQPRRQLRLPDAQEHWFRADDGTELRLTRYQAGDKGPVVLSPGIGTSRNAFLVDTVETNFPETLAAAGYDVWLLDYRASPLLEASKAPYTLDDIAARDYPAAVATVLEETGRESVQVVAHCIGSMTFLMAMTLGLRGVRSAVSSQLTLHPVAPPLNLLRSRARLATMLNAVGIKRMSTAFDADELDDRLLDRLMRVYPAVERCSDPVCRRIRFIYGDVYAHDQLNDETHANLGPLFGRIGLQAMQHLALTMREGLAVDASGRDRYLPHVDRLRIPITFVHGELNHIVLAEGSRRTFRLLCEANGRDLYRRHVVGDYAHMDCWIGKDAARDVFPLVLDDLERFN